MSKDLEKRLSELRADIDKNAQADLATTNAILSLLHLLLPDLAKHRLLDVVSITGEIDTLISQRAARQHPSYGEILADFRAILQTVSEENDAGRH